LCGTVREEGLDLSPERQTGIAVAAVLPDLDLGERVLGALRSNLRHILQIAKREGDDAYKNARRHRQA